jgi:hypothetical protein
VLSNCLRKRSLDDTDLETPLLGGFRWAGSRPVWPSPIRAILRPENPRFDGTPPQGRFTQVLDSTLVTALSYSTSR